MDEIKRNEQLHHPTHDKIICKRCGRRTLLLSEKDSHAIRQPHVLKKNTRLIFKLSKTRPAIGI